MPADPPDRPLFEPDAVAGKSFTQARRGYEPDEVRAFLLSVASQIREAKLRYEDMERRLVEVVRQAAEDLTTGAAPHDPSLESTDNPTH